MKLTELTDAEKHVLYRNVALGLVAGKSRVDICAELDLTDTQFKAIQRTDQFTEALHEAQSKVEDAVVARSIATQEDILRETAASLETLTLIRDAHTPGKTPDIPEHELPSKKDHWLAAGISKDLLDRAGLGKIHREQKEISVKIDPDSAKIIAEALQDPVERAKIVDLSREDLKSGKYSHVIDTVVREREALHAAEGVEPDRQHDHGGG